MCKMGLVMYKTEQEGVGSTYTTDRKKVTEYESCDNGSCSSGKTEADHIIEELEEKMAIAKQYMKLWNHRSFRKIRKVLTNDFVGVFNKKDGKVEIVTWSHMKLDARKIYSYFPDFKMKYEFIEAKSKTGTVVLGNVVASSSHRRGKNDPTNITVHFRENMICRIEVETKMDDAIGFHSPVGRFPAYLNV